MQDNVPRDFLRSWVGMLKGVGLMNVLIVGLVRSKLNIFSLNVHFITPGDINALAYMKQIHNAKYSKLSITAAFLIKLCFV